MHRLFAALLGGFFMLASCPEAVAAEIKMLCWPPGETNFRDGAEPAFSGVLRADGSVFQIYIWGDGHWHAVIIKPDGRRCPVFDSSGHANNEELIELLKRGEGA